MASSVPFRRALSLSSSCAEGWSGRAAFYKTQIPGILRRKGHYSTSVFKSTTSVVRLHCPPVLPSLPCSNVFQTRNFAEQVEQLSKNTKESSMGDNDDKATTSLKSTEEPRKDQHSASSEATPARKPVHIPPSFLGAPEGSDQWSRRALKWFGRSTGFYTRKAVFTRGSLHLYANLIDSIDYGEFFEVCKLPDTMQSWFLVAHLHVWFLLVRLKREGEDGKVVIKHVVEMFWKDVKNRMAMLGVQQSRLSAESMRELTQQFYGLTIAYEEGLQSDDKVLAAAIWRNYVTEKEQTNLEVLVTMVDYIRRQVQHMDSIDATDIMVHGKLSLLPLRNK